MILRYSKFALAATIVSLATTLQYTNAFTTKSNQRSNAPDVVIRASDDSSHIPTEPSSDGIAFSPGEATLRLGTNTGPTVWTEFGRIAEETNPVNLGQGFPDWLPPKFAVDSLVEAVLDSAQSPHQYTRPAGHPNLVKQLARRYSIHMRREIDPMEEVAVTVGASQALYLSLQTLVKPGKNEIGGLHFIYREGSSQSSRLFSVYRLRYRRRSCFV